MPSVASEASPISPYRSQPSMHRTPAEADRGSPTNPFAAFLDSAAAEPRPKQPGDRAERPEGAASVSERPAEGTPSANERAEAKSNAAKGTNEQNMNAGAIAGETMGCLQFQETPDNNAGANGVADPKVAARQTDANAALGDFVPTLAMAEPHSQDEGGAQIDVQLDAEVEAQALVQPQITVPAHPETQQLAAVIAAPVSDVAEGPALAPEATAPETVAIASQVAGKVAEPRRLDKPAQPQTKIEAEAKAKPAPTPTSEAGRSAPDTIVLETPSRSGEKPDSERQGLQPRRETSGHERTEVEVSSTPRLQKAPGAAPPSPTATEADPQTKPSAAASASPKASPDSSRAQPGFDPGAAVKIADTAMQNLGLLPSANQGPTGNVAISAPQPATSPPAQAAPPLPVPLAGLAVEIATAAQTGKQRFEIRLDPPELGRIDVRLDVDRDGNVTSRMTVERADTLDLLKRDAAQLERALQQAGLKTSDAALEFSLRQQAFARDENASENTARLIVSEDNPAPIEVALQGYGRLLGLGGGLDIRV